jgi:hypothetical protein
LLSIEGSDKLVSPHSPNSVVKVLIPPSLD